MERKFHISVSVQTGRVIGVTTNAVGGLEALQARVEGAAVEIKATTMASRNKNKFMVPERIRELASRRHTVKRKFLRKKAQKARRELDATMGALPRDTSRQEARGDEAVSQWKGNRKRAITLGKIS